MRRREDGSEVVYKERIPLCADNAMIRSCGNLLALLVREIDYVEQTEQTLQHRVDHLECLVDLLADLGTSKNDLARDENQ